MGGSVRVCCTKSQRPCRDARWWFRSTTNGVGLWTEAGGVARVARVAADAGEAMGEDAAADAGAEVCLDPLWDAVAIEIGRCGVGEEGFEVVLDERVEGYGGGIAAGGGTEGAVGDGAGRDR